MILKIYTGCQTNSIIVSNSKIQYSVENIELKKRALIKIIDLLDDEEQVEFFIKDLSNQIQPIYGEYELCSCCGDRTKYEEFEL